MDGSILIIDNSHFEREKIKYILSNIGKFDIIQISSTDSFNESVSKLTNITLIIMDIAFPVEKEGFSMLSSIRNSPSLKNTPVIIITRSDSVEYRDTALKYSVNDYIAKPYKPSRLENSVRSIINVKKKFTYTVDKSAKIIMSFEEYFAKELSMANRTKQPLSIILITLIKPNEEKLKDSKNISELMEKSYSLAIQRVKQSLRVTDYAVLNNRDIIIVLPNTNSSGANTVSEKINLYIDIGLSSLGVAFRQLFYSTSVTYPDDGRDFQSLMEQALKRVEDKEMLEKFTNILDGTKEYARSRYKQFKK
jgi:DNA-binding response OmpR family regulator